MRERRFSNRRRERGLTVVELMVAMVIALIGTIVIFQVFAVSEEYKRRTTGGSDALQSGNFSLYQLERQLSWAGSGLARVANMWGCVVEAKRAGAPVFPAPAAFPAPFGVLKQQVRMAPVLIRDGGGANPDVVLAIGGSSHSVNTPVPVGTAPTATDVALINTLGIKKDDLLMVVEQGTTAKPCRIAQVQAGPTAAAPLPPAANPVTFNTAGTASGGFDTYSASSFIVNLGPAVCPPPPAPCARPGFVAFGVGTDPATGVTNVLLTYDLLFGAEAPFNGQPISLADNVVNLQAVYGVAATADDPKLAQWVAPTGAWDFDTLMNGSAASADLIARIRAVRIVVAARNAQWEKDVVTPGPVVLFQDLPPAAQVTVTLIGDDQKYRYKVFDTTIPVRNMLLANN